MDTVLALQEAVGVLSLDHDVGGLEAGLVPLQVVHNLIGEAVALCPAGVHPVEHLTPVLGLGTAGTGMEAHHGVVPVVVAGEQGLQAAALHLLGKNLKALLQLVQHGIVVFLLGHFADGHQVIPVGEHLFIPFNLSLRLLGLDHDLLALIRVIPEPGSLLHGMVTLQIIAQGFHIQRLRQAFQGRTAIVQLLLISIKFNIHNYYASYRQIFTDTLYFQTACVSSGEYPGTHHSGSEKIFFDFLQPIWYTPNCTNNGCTFFIRKRSVL